MKNPAKQSEADVQKEVVKYIRLVVPDPIIIANPFSELQLPGSDKWRWKVLGNAKAKGWEKHQPDLICINRISNFAIEIKTEAKDPFRPYRGGGRWITHSRSKEVEDVLGQAKYLHNLRKSGSFDVAMFGAGFNQCKYIVDYSMMLGADTNFQIAMALLNGGKYTPEEFYLPFLAKS